MSQLLQQVPAAGTRQGAAQDSWRVIGSARDARDTMRMAPPPTLHVLEVFQPDTGGVPEYVTALVAGLVSRGVRVSVACPSAAPAARRLRTVGADVIPLDVPRRPHPMADARAVARLHRWCSEQNVMLLHGHSTKAGLLAALAGARAGVPSLYTPHGWSFEQLVAPSARLGYAVYERQLVRRFHAGVLAASASSREVAVRWRVAPREKVRVVATGIPPTRAVDPAAARERLGLRAQDTVAAWVGRNAAQKRPHDLIAAARALAGEVRIIALCAGVHGTPLEDELRDAGVLVADPGCDPATVYAAADMLIKTSGWEDASLVIVEAMNAGLPIVSYDVGGVGEQVRAGRTGYLVAPGDVAMLCDCVRALARRPDMRQRMADAARARVQQRFRYEVMLDQVLTAYAEATGLPVVRTRRPAADSVLRIGGRLIAR